MNEFECINCQEPCEECEILKTFTTKKAIVTVQSNTNKFVDIIVKDRKTGKLLDALTVPKNNLWQYSIF